MRDNLSYQARWRARRKDRKARREGEHFPVGGRAERDLPVLTYAPGRRCSRCGCRLSIYHGGNSCYSCGRFGE